MADDDKYMGRGKAQVLFNHLPASTFDYDRGFGIHQVSKIRGEIASNLDRDYLGEQIIRRVRQWNREGGSLGSRGYPDFADNYTFLTPTQVKTDFFPLLLTCENSSCGRAHYYQSSNQLAYRNSELECEECGGEISQEQFVGFHECGQLESLAPSQSDNPHAKPGSCTCGEQRWRLDTQGSQRLQNFRWVCMNCKNREELSQRCGGNCDLESQYLSFNVHRGSNVYQPHYFNIVSISSTGSNRLGSTGEAIAVLAKYLGLSDESISQINIQETKASSERQELEDMLEQLRNRGLDSSAEEVQNELSELEDSGTTIREEVGEFVPELIAGLESEDASEYEFAMDAVQELYEQLAISSQLNTRPARDVILARGDADLRARESLIEQADDVGESLEARGLSRVGLIEDFPITSVVFGYSRGGREPTESVLVSFSADDVELESGQVESSRTPAFIDTVRTEAIRFGLSPAVVIDWLLANSQQDTELGNLLSEQIHESSLPNDRGIPVDPDWTAGETSEWLTVDHTRSETESYTEWSEKEIRGWLAENMMPIPEYDTISLEDPANVITYFIYHLVHSFSHQVLKFGTSIIGMERTSISEYLLPRSLSFIIYTNQRTDFNLGGMHALVESGLDELVEQISQEGDNCVYDPVCSRGGSTCFNCMFISEVSCSHLNRNLGRDFLFGSRRIADRDLIGYLEMADAAADARSL
jgi:hypothetical protein